MGNGFINDRIRMIKEILSENCKLSSDSHEKLIDLLDDIRILSDATNVALETTYSELRKILFKKSI
jgi:hypothetical protein